MTASVTSSATIPFASNVACTATAAAGVTPTFQINCGNGQTINAATGTCNYTAFGTSIATCSVNGQLAANIPAVCQKTIVAQTGGGGGGPGTCESLTTAVVSNVNAYAVAMSCIATTAAQPNPVYEIRCGNESGQIINGSSGTCLYTSSANSPYQAACYVNGSTSGGPNTGCRAQVTPNAGAPLPPGSYCGDGIIDKGIRTFPSLTLVTGASCIANYTPAVLPTLLNPTGTPAQFINYTCTVNTDEQCDAGNIGGVRVDNNICSNCRFTGGSTNPGRCAR